MPAVRVLQRRGLWQNFGAAGNSRVESVAGLKSAPPGATISLQQGGAVVPDLGLDIDKLSPAQLNGVMAAAVAVGTLYCFLGYRTLRFVIALTGFLLAGGVAGAIALWVTRGNEVAALIGLGLGGISGALALFFVYRAGIFLMGLLGAALVADHIFRNSGDARGPLIVFGIGIVGGLMALVLEKPVMLIATSILGAWMLTACGAYFYSGGTDPVEPFREAMRSEDQRLWVVGAWAALSVIGFVSQFATTRGVGPVKKVAVPAA
jgi:hypothetical protein